MLQRQVLGDAIQASARMATQRSEIDALSGRTGRTQEEDTMPAASSPAQRDGKPDNTGLPSRLKSGIESLSGISMDHVRVHYDSDRPAQFQALAYAQGNEIHLGAGQEKHLPHEAWHIVQQAQGRVRPNLQMKTGAVNDDPALESEADTMGEKAAHFAGGQAAPHPRVDVRAAGMATQRAVVQRKIGFEVEMNVPLYAIGTEGKTFGDALTDDFATGDHAALEADYGVYRLDTDIGDDAEYIARIGAFRAALDVWRQAPTSDQALGSEELSKLVLGYGNTQKLEFVTPPFNIWAMLLDDPSVQQEQAEMDTSLLAIQADAADAMAHWQSAYVRWGVGIGVPASGLLAWMENLARQHPAQTTSATFALLRSTIERLVAYRPDASRSASFHATVGLRLEDMGALIRGMTTQDEPRIHAEQIPYKTIYAALNQRIDQLVEGVMPPSLDSITPRQLAEFHGFVHLAVQGGLAPISKLLADHLKGENDDSAKDGHILLPRLTPQAVRAILPESLRPQATISWKPCFDALQDGYGKLIVDMAKHVKTIAPQLNFNAIADQMLTARRTLNHILLGQRGFTNEDITMLEAPDMQANFDQPALHVDPRSERIRQMVQVELRQILGENKRVAPGEIHANALRIRERVLAAALAADMRG